jgi:hypothetical protein
MQARYRKIKEQYLEMITFTKKRELRDLGVVNV